MRDYGKVHSKFWSSQTTGSMGDDAKLLAVYLLSCQHSTIAGVFRLPDGYVAEDLGWTLARVSKGFAELSEKGFASRCDLTKWVWVIKHLEWNPPENPNQRKSAAKIAQTIPKECAWLRVFVKACFESLGLEIPAFDNPSTTVQKGLLNQEQKQEQEQEQKAGTEVAPAAPAFSEKTVLAEGVDAVHLKDWIKARKAPLTRTAWEGVKSEALKAGITPAEAVRICAIKGWRGFDATWKWQGVASASPASSDSRDDEILRLMAKDKQPEETIDG